MRGCTRREHTPVEMRRARIEVQNGLDIRHDRRQCFCKPAHNLDNYGHAHPRARPTKHANVWRADSTHRRKLPDSQGVFVTYNHLREQWLNCSVVTGERDVRQIRAALPTGDVLLRLVSLCEKDVPPRVALV